MLNVECWPGRRWLAALVVVALWGLATHGTHAGEGDEPHYLAIAHSIAFDFDFDLSNNYGPDAPLIGGGALTPGPHVRPGIDGTSRPVHDVGLPLLFAVFPRLGVPLVSWLSAHLSDETMRRLRVQPTTLYKHFVTAVMIPVAALLALQVCGALRARGTPVRAAFGWALLFALSPPLLVISISFFTEVVSALLCVMVFRALMEDQRFERRAWLLAGAGTGLLFLVHARNAGLVAGLLLLATKAALKGLTTRETAVKGLTTSAASFFAGFGVLFALRTLITHHFWGTWLTSPHARSGEWAGAGVLVNETARRAAGMLFDQEFGLLPYAPIFMLVPVGLWQLARTDRELFRALTFVIGGYLVLVLLPLTNAHGWTGGWSPAARFWVPVIPLLTYPVVLAANVLPRVALIIVLALQIGINAYMWQNPKSYWNDGDGIAAVCSRTGARFCDYLPSFVIEQERQRPGP